MQHHRTFRTSFVTPFFARQLAFSAERPPESLGVAESKADDKQPLSPVEPDAKRTQLRERREERNRRETWEQGYERMSSDELLYTLGDLRVKSEDMHQQLNDVYIRQDPDHLKQISLQANLIYEQQAIARQVLMDRKSKPLANKVAEEIADEEVSGLQVSLANARKQLSQFPATSPRYSEERLKTAVLEEHAYVAQAARAMAVRKHKRGEHSKD